MDDVCCNQIILNACDPHWLQHIYKLRQTFSVDLVTGEKNIH